MANIGAIFKKALPFIGAAASGNVPALISMAANTVGQALEKKVDSTSDAIAQAVAGATPEQLLKLKELELGFQQQMAALGFQDAEELAKLATEDRASARQREIQAHDSWTPRVLAAIVVAGWLSIQWFIFRHVIPAEMRDIAMRSMGTFDMALGLVLGYYFGSSSGSHQKDDVIATVAKNGSGS